MLLLQLSSLCIALTTIFFGAMYSCWPPADWWPSAASIWSSLQSPTHNEPREFPSIGETRTFSSSPSSPPLDDQHRHPCPCRIDSTRTVGGLASMDTATDMIGYLLILAATMALTLIIGLGFLYWLQATYISKILKRRVSKVRPKAQSLKITKPSSTYRYRADSTTPERGRRLHRRGFHPVHPLIYYRDNSRADDYFAGPVEVKRWIIRDDLPFVRENEDDRYYTRERDYGPEANSVHLPGSFESVSSVNTSPSETQRLFLSGEGFARNQNQSPLTDLQGISDESLNPVSSANPSSNNENEAENPTALIAWSRDVQRVEYRFEERESTQPPSISRDAVSPAQTSDGSASFVTAPTSIKNSDCVERPHYQHLAEKFKELESYQPGASSESPARVPIPSSTTTGSSNGSTKNEGTDWIFPFELDAKGPSPPASPSPGNLETSSLSPASSSSSSSSYPSPFGGFQYANGLWNIDQASTLPFGAKSGKKRRTRHRSRKGRARRKGREEAEAKAEAEKREAVSI